MSVNESGAAAVRKKAEKRYVGGMLILSVSTLICKIIGLFFKIPMLGLIGIEGMAYFSSAYHIYILLLTFSTSGLPVALSMMTAKSSARGDRAEVGRIFGVSLRLLLPLLPALLTLLFYYLTLFLCGYFFGVDKHSGSRARNKGDLAHAFLHLRVERRARIFSGA